MNRQATAAAAAKGDPPVVTMAQPEPEGFTEPELKLYHHLMETRADLARRNSTAP
jgi:hypothetical protein